jgi:hypothetical protein
MIDEQHLQAIDWASLRSHKSDARAVPGLLRKFDREKSVEAFDALHTALVGDGCLCPSQATPHALPFILHSIGQDPTVATEVIAQVAWVIALIAENGWPQTPNETKRQITQGANVIGEIATKKVLKPEESKNCGFLLAAIATAQGQYRLALDIIDLL